MHKNTRLYCSKTLHMAKIAWYLVCFFYLPISISAQVFPAEGALLNYRIVGFTFPPSAKAKGYTLEIARGIYFHEDSFQQTLVATVASGQSRVISEVPSFGAQYTWRVIYNGDNGVSAKSEFHHFATGMVPAVDTLTTRIKILHPAEKFKDAYIFLDGNKALYDMNGKPVWYLPGTDDHMPVRDLKLSHRNTITLMSGLADGEQISEIDYDGRLLWKGPNDGKVSGEHSEYYHHQFSRLSNGHYMVLGNEFAYSSLDSNISADSNILVAAKPEGGAIDHVYVKVPLLTVIEYDESGKVAWKWNSLDYFLHSDVRFRKRKSAGIFDDVHGNGFFFDQQKQYLYVSFRDISRILKISYPDGKVVGEFGREYKPGEIDGDVMKDQGNGFYCYQHYCIPAAGGSFYVFNNNSCNQVTGPTIVKLQEPKEPRGKLTKIWEYPCKVEAPFDNKDFSFTTGGNIAELPDKSLFINMGGIHSRLSIVTEDKKELWSALPERRNTDGKWNAVPEYRACILFRNDLEALIFGKNAPAPSDDIMITYNTNK